MHTDNELLRQELIMESKAEAFYDNLYRTDFEALVNSLGLDEDTTVKELHEEWKS
jgi:hypothetical protein